MPNPKPTKHAVFSFFSGAGFLDLGFEAAGFEVVFAYGQSITSNTLG